MRRQISTPGLLVVFATLACAAAQADTSAEEREARQAELDTACEVAREKALVSAKTKSIAECVEKKQRPDRASCERFYADYGQRSPNQAPLFYDLPECEAAHEHRTSYRNPDK